MAIKYYLTVSNGNYTIETTEGCGFSGSCANLACAFDDSAESVRVTDKAWRNWMPILDATAEEIETNGEEKTYSQLIAYLQSIMTCGGGGGTGSVNWGAIGGTLSNQSDLNSVLSAKQDTLIAGNNIVIGSDGKTISATGGGGGGASWGEISGTISNQTDLTTALNGKASSTHSHQQSDISGLSTALGGKANIVHSHAVSDVTNLQSALDGKQAALTFDDAPTAGSSNPVKSSGIKSALDGKQATLTAGTNITIVGNVISASGGGGTSVPCYYVNCHQSGGSWVLENPSELTPIYTALSAFISAPAGYANANSMFFVLQPSNDTTQVDWIVFNEIIRESASSPVFHVTFVTKQQGRRGTFDLTVNATQQTASLAFEPEAETLTEAQYAALTKDATKVYYVVANS